MTDAYYVAQCNVSVSPPTVGVQYIPAAPPPPPPNMVWLYRNGVRIQGRTLDGRPVSFDHLEPGTHTIRIYAGYTEDAAFISESAPFTVPGATAATPAPAPAPIPAPAETGTLSGVPTSGTAGTTLATSGTFNLTNAPSSGTTAYVGLFNVTTGVYQGALQAVAGTSGSLPTLTPARAATYAVWLCADSAGAHLLATSPNIAVAAAAPAPTPAPAPSSSGPIAPDGTLTGLPSTIAAGQPLSAATYGQSTGYFVLYRVAGAVEEGLRWGTNVMSGNLNLLIPQTAGAYTVRRYDAATGGNVTYESAQINVTVAPGALPATPTQAADTGTTSSGTTMNWTSTATSYRVLARPGVGSVYGSLADATVSTNSYTFTGLAPNSSPRAVIVPQNANGYGTPSGQFVSFTTA